MHFETLKLHRDLTTDLKAVSCLVKVLFVCLTDTQGINMCVKQTLLFSRGPVAVVFAFKPEWKMFLKYMGYVRLGN